MFKKLLCCGLFLCSSLVHANGVWQSLNFKSALVFKNGHGEQQVAMITDINCGYCRMLEKELDQIDNVTIYKFLTPVKGGYSQSVSIWCAANRNSAYVRSTQLQEMPKVASCNNPISSNLVWFYTNRLIGTPALIKPNGAIKYGHATKEEITKWLQSR